MPGDLHYTWEQRKAAEKGRTSALQGIPEQLSALARANKIISRARSRRVEVALPDDPTTAEEVGTQILDAGCPGSGGRNRPRTGASRCRTRPGGRVSGVPSRRATMPGPRSAGALFCWACPSHRPNGRPRRRIRHRRIRHRTTRLRTNRLRTTHLRTTRLRTIPLRRTTRRRTTRSTRSQVLLSQNPQTYPLNPTAPYPVQPQYRAVPRKPSEELRTR